MIYTPLVFLIIQNYVHIFEGLNHSEVKCMRREQFYVTFFKVVQNILIINDALAFIIRRKDLQQFTTGFFLL